MSIYEKLSNRITWNEFLKLSKDTEKRQQVSSNLDEQEAKLFLDNRNTPIKLSFQNSFPNYGEILNGYHMIYIGKNPSSTNEEVIRLLQDLRKKKS